MLADKVAVSSGAADQTPMLFRCEFLPATDTAVHRVCYRPDHGIFDHTASRHTIDFLGLHGFLRLCLRAGRWYTRFRQYGSLQVANGALAGLSRKRPTVFLPFAHLPPENGIHSPGRPVCLFCGRQTVMSPVQSSPSRWRTFASTLSPLARPVGRPGSLPSAVRETRRRVLVAARAVVVLAAVGCPGCALRG